MGKIWGKSGLIEYTADEPDAIGCRTRYDSFAGQWTMGPANGQFNEEAAIIPKMLREIRMCPLVIKHGNGKSTILCKWRFY